MLFLGIGIEAILQFIPAVSKYIYYEPNKVLFLSDWIKWLLPIVFFIFIQSAAEELVFRGYLLRKIWSKIRAKILSSRALHMNTNQQIAKKFAA